MTSNELNGIRLMAETMVAKASTYGVMIGASVVAFNLTRETAIEWANSYAHRGARVVTMSEINKLRGAR